MKPGDRLGPYEVVDLLGEGGMGEVYKARDARLQRDVAIKVLPAAVFADPERRARFEREARTLASLNHPHRHGGLISPVSSECLTVLSVTVGVPALGPGSVLPHPTPSKIRPMGTGQHV